MDHAYETYNSDNVHNTKFTWFSEECFDSSFLFDCKGCSNCFGCINLRNKKYYIWNEPYSKKEYEQKMQEWDLGSYEISKKAMKQFLELYYKTPRRFAWMTNAVNVTGDNIKNTKNCHHAFGTLDGVENCKYLLMVGLNIKDSYDLTFAGQTCELLYENIGSIRNQKTFFCNGGADLIECEYCNTCRESRYLFGCICMRNKKHCILNKQYSKEEYSALVPKIKQHLNEMPYQDKRGNEYTYGEFFPDEISPWTYNESYAYQWFPLTKEEALQKGYRWRDREKQNYNTTLEANDLPNHIKDVPDTITKEIIECADKAKCNHNCTEAFKIIPEELNFYRHSNVALPRLCPNCRYGKRIELRTQPKLWRRKCENEECENEFETAYSPERKEIIWCQECYNNKFV
ncbi:hypothetical protein CL629_02445 [bacterium]|nr:hypothetical protein [bacterium]